MTAIAEPRVRAEHPAPTRRVPTVSGARVLLNVSICLGAYLYGSLPFVYLLGRGRRVDLRQRGSGNVGATNLWSTAGNWPAVIGWLGDASKGLVPAALTRLLGGSRATSEMMAVCGAAGQCWPLFLGLRGGRGISAFVGAALWINPRAWVASLLPMIGGSLWRTGRMTGPRVTRIKRQLKTTRSMSVPFGCLLGVLTFPVVSQASARRRRSRSSLAPTLLALVIVLRRLTARLPDDATHGPAVQRGALLFRLLFDRNTRK